MGVDVAYAPSVSGDETIAHAEKWLRLSAALCSYDTNGAAVVLTL